MIIEIKKSKIGRKMLIFLTKILSVLNQIIPKREDQILFYDSARDFLDDNTEALYSYLKENGYEKKYKMICCVPNEKKLSFSTYKPINASAGVLAFLRSKYVFFSFGDFRIKPSKNQIVVNQWHAAPTKKIGKLMYDENYHNEDLNNFTYIVSTSEKCSPILAKAFGCNLEQVIVTGNARNDYLFSKKKSLEIMGISTEYKKKILWMPTFRKSNDDRFFDGSVIETETMLPIIKKYEDLRFINDILKEKNMLLMIKIHPMAVFRDKIFSNIMVLTNNDIIPKGIKLYEFVKEFDALITDYSSVYCDFLVLDRPIAFTLDDYKEYEKTRGFVFDDFIQYMPGHRIFSVADMKTFFSDVYYEKDNYSVSREKAAEVFCKYKDAGNCERLINKVGITRR